METTKLSTFSFTSFWNTFINCIATFPFHPAKKIQLTAFCYSVIMVYALCWTWVRLLHEIWFSCCIGRWHVPFFSDPRSGLPNIDCFQELSLFLSSHFVSIQMYIYFHSSYEHNTHQLATLWSCLGIHSFLLFTHIIQYKYSNEKNWFRNVFPIHFLSCLSFMLCTQKPIASGPNAFLPHPYA